jgi:hypothetical protein
MLVQIGHLLRESLWQAEVVCVLSREVFTCCELQCPVEGKGKTSIFLMDDANPRVFACIQNVATAIFGTVIDGDNFEVPKILGKYAV